MSKQAFLFILVIFLAVGTVAQETFPVNGVHPKNHVFYAFTNAIIYTDYQTRLENATLLVQDGKVVETGTKVKIPKGAVVYDLKGKRIYPSLIDIYTNYGIEQEKKPKQEWGKKPQFISDKKGAFNWNEAIHPEINASEAFSVNKKDAENLRKLGFGTVLTHNKDGIARGTSAFVTLDDERENKIMLHNKAAAHYSFSKGTSGQNYPSSLMGAIALLRQTYLDAQWYQQHNGKKEKNLSLEAFNRLQDVPQVFEVNDYRSILRADKVGDEFGTQYIIKGGGDEYKRIEAVKATNASLIVPVNFPQPYDVEDPYDALVVSLEDLKHWELAPANPALLAKENIEFALTADGLKEQKDFWKNLRKAIEYGLSDTAALKALTYTPAKMVGMENRVGALQKGMLANFLITSGDLFDKENIIYENWVQGNQHIIADKDLLDIRGVYSLNVDAKVYELEVKGKREKPAAKVFGKDTVKAIINQDNKLITLAFELDDDNFSGMLRLSGKINYNSGTWDGKAQLPDGRWADWSTIRKEEAKEANKDTAPDIPATYGRIFYPNMAYGMDSLPQQETFMITNATVWTNEEAGVLKNADVAVRKGKIIAVGTGLKKEGLFPEEQDIKIIDAAGKHLTSGIIDEHSHIAIDRGVNEGSQAVTAEVSIGDVVNSDDVNIYRQLSGGVTAAQLLHGSANPVGGQSALIKMRWGRSPEEMKIEAAEGFIKFALGENVKQSNWGDHNRYRYPQTRMGVEQVYYDAFIRAREYKNKWDTYNNLKKKDKEKAIPPRRDLELEVLAEILDKKRFITCHSYIQSEINMLMHVADSMGFNINTFTHILEGYKVADKMKAHGVGGSTFSDWWAYKFEVNDAIPYNGALMHGQGVVTAFNSDDAEMGRRLNQEAAKAVKYGGVSEEEAWKFVTLNPAKLLHLNDRMGSIKKGKDADLVLWTDHPLSVYSKAEKTIVDGIVYFDLDKDKELREQITREKMRIIKAMIKAKEKGEKTRKPERKEQKLYECETLEDDYMLQH